MRTFHVSTLLITSALFTSFSVHSQETIKQGKTILLTLGADTSLPPGAKVTFHVQASRSHLALPAGFKSTTNKNATDAAKDNSSRSELPSSNNMTNTGNIVGIPHDDLPVEERTPEVRTFSGTVDKAGYLESQVSTFTFSSPMAVANQKLSIIEFEVNVEIMLGQEVLFNQVTKLPYVLKPTDKDIIPVCISTYHKENTNGKMTFGIARHSCEAPIDHSKAKASRKS